MYMINKYGLYLLSILALSFSFYGAYLKINSLENHNLFLLISAFSTTILMIYLLLYIKQLRKNQQNEKNIS